MTAIEKARQLFRKSKLAFPTIPDKLAARVKELDEWLFSTREIEMSPYNLDDYVLEVNETHVEDYAVLSHSGHGANSYAIQYYVVYGALRMFLHLGWGGVYMNAREARDQIRDCFSLADEIIPAVQTGARLRAGGPANDSRLGLLRKLLAGSGTTRPGERHGSQSGGGAR